MSIQQMLISANYVVGISFLLHR